MKSGFLLIHEPVQGQYSGVDGNVLVPEIKEGEFEDRDLEEGETLWDLCRIQWKKNAFKLYEENLLVGSDFLINNQDSASRIRAILDGEPGPKWCVCKTNLYNPEESIFDTERIGQFVGWDIAYEGGDLYSALKNGIFVNPSEALRAAYQNQLNEYGLFQEPK